MRAFASALLVVLVVASARAKLFGAERQDQAGVVVRVYDASRLPADQQRAALAVAAEIVRGAHAAVVWQVCDLADSARRAQEPVGAMKEMHNCEVPIIAGELILRIIPSPLAWRRVDGIALGQSLIDRGSGRAVFATVYADRVEWQAGQSRVSRPVLMGRTIAHELGHLLLATTAHSDAGLMRAVWTTKELRDDQRSDWMFRPIEVASIQARAAGRRSVLQSARGR